MTSRGWAVVGAGYRLHPQVQHPVYIEDAAAALAWTFIDKYAPLYHVRQDAPPILCVTGGWEVDMLMRAEENLYFVSMLKLVGHKAVKHIVIKGADHGQCGAACWPHVIAFVEHRLAEM